MPSIGKLTKVDLREVWKNEASDFTKWLGKDENIAFLGDELGIDFQEVETEHPVGRFSADILATDSAGNKVIIENQLEATDHDHLGKVITYAAGVDANLCVWIVKHAREEHRSAVQWLNEHTDMNVGFFLVEVSAVRIGNSDPAPLFKVVEQPNDWAKSVKPQSGLSDSEKLKLAYWQSFKEAAEEDSAFMAKLKPQKPRAHYASDIAVGTSKYHLVLLVSPRDKYIGAELYIPNDKEIFKSACEQLDVFEKHLGQPCTTGEGGKVSYIMAKRTKSDISDTAQWAEFNEWHIKAALAMKAALEELGM